MFSWAKALRHVVIVAVIWFTLGLVLAGVGAFPNPVAAGKAFFHGQIWLTVCTLLISYGWQMRRWMPAAFGIVLALSLLALMVQAYVSVRFASVLSAAERAPLLRAAGRLCHPRFAFSLPDPGPGFQANDELAAKVKGKAEDEDMAFWIWTHPETGESLILNATKGRPRKREFFTGLAAGAREKLLETYGAIEAERLDVEAPEWTHELAATHPNGAAFDSRCVFSAPPAKSLVVCVQTAAADHEAYRFLREGLTWGECGP